MPPVDPAGADAARADVGLSTIDGTSLMEAMLVAEAKFLDASLEMTLTTDETGIGNGRTPELTWDPEEEVGVPLEKLWLLSGAPLELIGSELAGVEPEELGEAGALDADWEEPEPLDAGCSEDGPVEAEAPEADSDDADTDGNDANDAVANDTDAGGTDADAADADGTDADGADADGADTDGTDADGADGAKEAGLFEAGTDEAAIEDATAELDGTDATLDEPISPGELDPALDGLEPSTELEAGPVDADAVETGADVAGLLEADAAEDGSGGAGAGIEGTGAGLRSVLSDGALDPAVALPVTGAGSTVTVRVPTTTVVDGSSP